MATGNNFVDNNPNDLSSAEERADYFEGITGNPNQQVYSPNDIHIALVNNGNDVGLRDAVGYTDSNSGKASQYNNATARLGDAMMSGVDRSTADEMKSGDRSATARVNSGVESGYEFNEEDMPLVRDKEDSNPIIQAVYGILLAVGVSRNSLDEGLQKDMGARETLEAFYEMAEEANFPQLAEFIQQADEALMNFELEDGVDAAPVVGTEPEPTDPQVVLQAELANNPELEQQVGMSGPKAPA